MSIQFKLVSGSEFNILFPDEKFVKLTNETENHNDFQFKTGLNEDHLQFSPVGSCSSGGLYFINVNDIGKWLRYINGKIMKRKVMKYVRVVTIPDDASIWIEDGKYKTNKFTLSERKEIFTTREYCSLVVRKCGSVLKYINEQTPEICLSVVRNFGLELENVDHVLRTPDICLAAVKENGFALKFVIDQTTEICMAAVGRHGLALQFVEKQTPEICLTAVKREGSALQFVEKQTPEICLAAVSEYGAGLEYVKEQTSEMCLTAVMKNYFALQHVKVQTEEICLAAVKMEGTALRYVNADLQTPEICMAAVKQNGLALLCVKKQTSEICLAAIEECGEPAFNFVKEKTEEMFLAIASRKIRCELDID